MPGVKVKYSMSDKSKAKLSSGLGAARLVLKAAGASRSWAFGPVRETGWHTLGTCCMGKDETLAVTNEHGRVHGIQNLYVADGSLLTRGGSVNPANTIQALGLLVGSSIGNEK